MFPHFQLLHFHVSAFSTFAFPCFRIFNFCISMFPHFQLLHFHVSAFSTFAFPCFRIFVFSYFRIFMFLYFHIFVFSCFCIFIFSYFHVFIFCTVVIFIVIVYFGTGYTLFRQYTTANLLKVDLVINYIIISSRSSILSKLFVYMLINTKRLLTILCLLYYSQTGCSLASNIAILSHNIAILIGRLF